MRHRKPSIISGLAVLSVLGPVRLAIAVGEAPPPLSSTLCELVRNSGKFQNTPVSIRVTIHSNGVDHAFLSSADCPGGSMLLEHMGIESPPSNVGLGALFTSIFRIGGIGTVDKEITATVIGRVTKIAQGTKVASFRISDVRELTMVWKNADTSVHIGRQK
jgi:hypothetical protein